VVDVSVEFASEVIQPDNPTSGTGRTEELYEHPKQERSFVREAQAVGEVIYGSVAGEQTEVIVS